MAANSLLCNSHPPPPPHQARPSSGPIAPSSPLWLQVLKHSSSPFPSQAMHPPPLAHGSPPVGRDWRGQNDGGNNASTDNQRTDAPDADRTLRSRSAYCKRTAEISGRLPERANALSSLRNIRYALAPRLLAVTGMAKAAHAMHARPSAGAY
jgi:hypothetical protein